MEKFIKDLRLAVGVPNLPFVIATTGQSDPMTYSQVELAQLANGKLHQVSRFQWQCRGGRCQAFLDSGIKPRPPTKDTTGTAMPRPTT